MAKATTKKSRGNKAGKRKAASEPKYTFPGYQTRGSGKGKKGVRRAYSYGKGKK
jgi:hypothetical protein